MPPGVKEPGGGGGWGCELWIGEFAQQRCTFRQVFGSLKELAGPGGIVEVETLSSQRVSRCQSIQDTENVVSVPIFLFLSLIPNSSPSPRLCTSFQSLSFCLKQTVGFLTPAPGDILREVGSPGFSSTDSLLVAPSLVSASRESGS